MSRRPWGPWVFLVPVLLVVACARPVPTPTPTPTPAPAPAGSPHEAPLALAVRLAEMWGHLEASAENARAGDAKGARAHASHPIAESWAMVKGDLEALGLAEGLRSALDTYHAKADTPDWEPAFEAARRAVQEALRKVAGPAWEDPAFLGALARDLLERVEREYAEAVEGGRVVDLEEYQDARGLWRVVRELLPGFAGVVKARDPKAHREMEEMAERLEALFRENAPESAPADPAEVGEWVGEMRAEIAKALGLKVGPAGGPREVAHRIEEWMEQALREYERGEVEEAYELAAKAYLEGFEEMEGDLLQKGHRALVERLEVRFKDLRDGIRAGRPLDELSALVEEIEAGLKEALEILEE